MKNLGQKVIMILCCCLFLTGCSIDSEYLILKKSEILDTKRFDKEYEKKMKKALENGTAQKRHFRFEWVSKSVQDKLPEYVEKERYVKLEDGQVYERYAGLKEGQVYLEIVLNITNDVETDQEWNIGNSKLLIPGSWEEFHPYYEIRYFSKHRPIVSKGAMKQYNTWTLEAKKTYQVKLGYGVDEKDVNDPNLLLQISPYYFSNNDPYLGGMIAYYRVNEEE